MMFGEGEYMTGQIEINGEKYAIAIHQNNRKSHSKQPDVRITALMDEENGEWGQLGAAWKKVRE